MLTQPVSQPETSRRSRGNVLLLVGFAVAALAVLAVTIGVLTLQKGPDRISVSTVSYDLSTPGVGRLTFDVAGPAARTVVCDVRGRTYDNQVAGELTGITVGLSAGGAARDVARVPLTKPAVIMEVVQCILLPAGQAGPTAPVVAATPTGD